MGPVDPRTGEGSFPSQDKPFGKRARAGRAVLVSRSFEGHVVFPRRGGCCLHDIGPMSIQTAQDKARFSTLRQRLRETAEEVVRLVQPFMSDKPVVRGTVYELMRKCGRRNYACARGKLHVSVALSTTVGRRKRLSS